MKHSFWGRTYFGAAVILGCWLGFLLISQTTEAKIIADKKNKIFHQESCSEVKNIKPRYIRIFDTEPEAESRGFYPCRKCIPPAREPSLKKKVVKKLSLPIAREKTYIGDKRKKIYHHVWCPLIKDMPDKYKRQFSSAKQALDMGYKPCADCGPPAMFKRQEMKSVEHRELPDIKEKLNPAEENLKPGEAQEEKKEIAPDTKLKP